jgi:hypothetical protein
MGRAVLALGGVLLVAGAVTANTPPPPEVFLKRVPQAVDYTVTTEKELPDYDFYLVGEPIRAVSFGPKKPIELKSKSEGSISYTLVAVPKGSDKKYASEADFHAALRKKDGIAGRVQATIGFVSPVEQFAQFWKPEPRVEAYEVEDIGPKVGIWLLTKEERRKKREADALAPLAPKKDAPDEEDAPGVSTHLPQGRMWIAGLTASLAVMLGGVWIVGRARRKV